MSIPVIKVLTRNSEFQYIETLRRNRVKRHQAGEFFVEGVRPINQAIQHGWKINAWVYSREKRLSDWAEQILAGSNALRHYELPARLMQEISLKEDTSELVALLAIPRDDMRRIPFNENLLVLVLDQPGLPGNIGSVIRSCDALQADGLVITGHSADLYDPETVRATTGSFFAVPSVRLASHRELGQWLERAREKYPDLQVVGTSEKAPVPVQEFDFRRPTVLVAGSETHGISENLRGLCDAGTTILMGGSASSLNLACASSIILYEVSRQRRAAGSARLS